MKNQEFEAIIQYRFREKALLEQALTHSSFCREHTPDCVGNNERLEFLGDAFLDAIISAQLYAQLPGESEGKLSKTRALIVCEKSLAQIGLQLDIGAYLNLGHGEETCGGRSRESILADAVEAVIGALYLDGGYIAAETFVTRVFRQTVADALAGRLWIDYKTEVQELLQRGGNRISLQYCSDRETGPDHDKTFYVHLECDGQTLGRGSGKSKKEAEQQAARDALERGIREHVF